MAGKVRLTEVPLGGGRRYLKNLLSAPEPGGLLRGPRVFYEHLSNGRERPKFFGPVLGIHRYQVAYQADFVSILDYYPEF